jgi:hypothetical protein
MNVMQGYIKNLLSVSKTICDCKVKHKMQTYEYNDYTDEIVQRFLYSSIRLETSKDHVDISTRKVNH